LRYAYSNAFYFSKLRVFTANFFALGGQPAFSVFSNLPQQAAGIKPRFENKSTWKKAIDYGISINIQREQLDFEMEF
jgi:hypothetical protein